MIGSGKTVSQIAEELHLGVATISTHRAHILEKMNLTTTAELIHYAVRNHLVDCKYKPIAPFPSEAALRRFLLPAPAHLLALESVEQTTS